MKSRHNWWTMNPISRLGSFLDARTVIGSTNSGLVYLHGHLGGPHAAPPACEFLKWPPHVAILSVHLAVKVLWFGCVHSHNLGTANVRLRGWHLHGVAGCEWFVSCKIAADSRVFVTPAAGDVAVPKWPPCELESLWRVATIYRLTIYRLWDPHGLGTEWEPNVIQRMQLTVETQSSNPGCGQCFQITGWIDHHCLSCSRIS